MPGGREAAVTCLWVVTPLTASLSLVIVTVAVTTNHWLITEESMLNPHYNGTGDRDYLPKHTVSGLFLLCYNNREYSGSFPNPFSEDNTNQVYNLNSIILTTLRSIFQ